VTSGDAISDVIDKIAPELVEIDGGDADEEDYVYVETTDSTIEAIVWIYFTERLDALSVSLDTFSVSGYDVTDYTLYTDGSLKLVVDLDGDESSDLIGKSVTQNSSVRDLLGNTTSGIDTEIQDENDIPEL